MIRRIIPQIKPKTTYIENNGMTVDHYSLASQILLKPKNERRQKSIDISLLYDTIKDHDTLLSQKY